VKVKPSNADGVNFDYKDILAIIEDNLINLTHEEPL
jgi:hypothetical protein